MSVDLEKADMSILVDNNDVLNTLNNQHYISFNLLIDLFKSLITTKKDTSNSINIPEPANYIYDDIPV